MVPELGAAWALVVGPARPEKKGPAEKGSDTGPVILAKRCPVLIWFDIHGDPGSKKKPGWLIGGIPQKPWFSSENGNPPK